MPVDCNNKRRVAWRALVKTRQMSNIPLLDIPLEIIEKYRGDKKAAKKGVLLPIPSNQVMNRYLKEIATICKIDKYLTTHVARHTYATVCLSQGVSLKNVSKMPTSETYHAPPPIACFPDHIHRCG